MISLCHKHTAQYAILLGLIYLFACQSMAPLLRAQQPQPAALSYSSTAPSAGWHSDQATLLTGFLEIKANTKGTLSISPTAVSFVTAEGSATVERAMLLSASTGDEREEMGGTAGRVTRLLIPFGGGAAVATVTNKQIGLLTLQFRGLHNALHGAVFILPKAEASAAKQQLGAPVESAFAQQPHAPCQTYSANTIRVTSIAVQGEPVPTEYKVLLYDQLLDQLREQGIFAGIYRAEDDSNAAECPQYVLTVTVDAFKKGNAALRASTGPVGFFVGTTSFKVQSRAEDSHGKVLFDKNFHVSERGDTESLNVTGKIAKTVTRNLKKATEQSMQS